MQGKALGYQKGYIGPGDTLCDENPTYEAVGSVISGGEPEHEDSGIFVFIWKFLKSHFHLGTFATVL